MALASSAVMHLTCRTRSLDRPGIMDARVTSRSSPISTSRLHARHLALPEGASPNENVCGRALNAIVGVPMGDARRRALH